MSRRLIDIENATFSWTEEEAVAYGNDFNGGVLLALDKLTTEAPTIDAVELPCKIGDTVYIARRYKCHKRPRKGVVSEMFFTYDMELCIVVKGVARGKWGVDVFATYEEAEAQIERNNRKD